MPTPSPMPKTARKRRTRVRTSNVSTQPPLLISALPPNEVDLRRPHKAVLYCPDCKTWCPVVEPQSPKLGPHDRKPAGTRMTRTRESLRCRGTNRRVVIDNTVAEWMQRWNDAAAATASRRSAVVISKPVTPTLPPVSEILPARPSAETARDACLAHRKRCAACTGRDFCTDGRRLADTFVRLLGEEPERQHNREVLEEFRQEVNRLQARQFPRRRANEWRRVARSVTRADTGRTQFPAGDAPTEWDVPTEPSGAAFAVRVHLGFECELLCDESRWRTHPGGDASMHLDDGLRLIWHPSLKNFTVASSETPDETTITRDNVHLVLAILADVRT